jgi:hypothetical protein
MFWMSWKAASISSSIFLFFSLAVSRSSETAAQCGRDYSRGKDRIRKKGNVPGLVEDILIGYFCPDPDLNTQVMQFSFSNKYKKLPVLLQVLYLAAIKVYGRTAIAPDQRPTGHHVKRKIKGCPGDLNVYFRHFNREELCRKLTRTRQEMHYYVPYENPFMFQQIVYKLRLFY